MPLKVKTNQFNRGLDRLSDSMRSAMVRAMERSVEDLKRESEALAPYKTGELVGSVQTEVQVQGQQVTGGVTYNTPYAARQHNDLSLKPGPGTAAKPQTKYGIPGPNYLLNPAEGLGRDGTYQKNFLEEVKKA